VDLSAVLLVVTAIGLVLLALQLSRVAAKDVLDWWTTLAVVGCIAIGAFLAVPQIAGHVALSAYFALVVSPRLLDRAAMRAARAGRDARARTLATGAAILHPFGVIGARRTSLAVMARVRATGALAEEDLQRLGGAGDPLLSEWWRVVAMHAAADASGLRRALAEPSRRARMIELGFGPAWVRAVAMTGDTADVIAAIEETERLDTASDDPERRALLALEACAALGDVDGARTLGEALAGILPRGGSARALAAAQIAAGDPETGRTTIDRALADRSLDPSVRRALERLRPGRLASARKTERSDALEARKRALLTRLRREADATTTLAPLAGGALRPTWLTWSILGALVAWHLVVNADGKGLDPTHLAKMGGLVVPMPEPAEALRLLSAPFVHLGPLHLLFNAFALVVFGRFVEAFYGRVRWIALWLVGSVVSGGAVALLADPSRPQILVGASGAIFGLGGALASGILFRSDLRASRRGREELRAFALIVGLQFVLDRLIPNVSATAHVFGLIGGLFAGAILVPRPTTLARS
jgi:membrane associated rhomboid family serine protease